MVQWFHAASEKDETAQGKQKENASLHAGRIPRPVE
jgi:hypothetical protein